MGSPKMRLFVLLTFMLSLLGATDVKIATYNVENLFDMNDDGTEYVEFIPNTSRGWNQAMYQTKLQRTAQVIQELGADIIGLQELESQTALKDLKAQLNRQGIYYPYYAFSRTKNSTIAVGILSKYPLKSALSHRISSHRAYRDILEAKVEINGHVLRIYVNHWKSKSGGEHMRVLSAKALKTVLAALNPNEPYLLIGDFNSHYEEYKTFLTRRTLNDTEGITGINHILKTIDANQNPITFEGVKNCNDCSYNLWYDLPEDQRWSHEYHGHYEALDNMIISPALANGGAIRYVRGSFGRFTPEYLLHKGKPYRWQHSKTYPKHHLGEGYSDHLAIYATFTFNP